MSSPALDRILRRLQGIRRSRAGYVARCPAHDDVHPSLSIGTGHDGKVLLHCHAGADCTPAAILDALGLSIQDLFDSDANSPRRRAKPQRVARARQATVRRTQRPLAGAPVSRKNDVARKPLRTTKYEIREIDGSLAAYHVRVDYDDGSKWVFWEGPKGESDLGGRKVETLPLFLCETLPSLPDGTTVIVCEGEKACMALVNEGIPAVATVTGAKLIPTDDVLRCLLRFNIVLWPDNDDTGRTHMRNIAARLAILGAQS